MKSPDDFEIIQDTREPSAEHDAPETLFRPCLRAKGEYWEPQIVRAKLDAGDYSLPGLEGVLAIERKTLPDLLGTLFGRPTDAQGEARSRLDTFRAELERARSLARFEIVIESEPSLVVEAARGRRWDPLAVFALLRSIRLDYGYPVTWALNRSGAELEIGSWLARAWEQHTGGPAWKKAEERGHAASLPWGPPSALAAHRLTG